MTLSLLGSATCSVPDSVRTELRTMLAIAFSERIDRACNPSQVATSPTILTRRGRKWCAHVGLIQVTFGGRY
jgi:hypothetical protein